MYKKFTRQLYTHSKNIHEETQYLQLISDIINNGDSKIGRNGLVYSKIGASMRFSLENNVIPLITTKKVAWRTCLKELLWFINGETDNSILQNQNVKIWNDNATRDFLDSREFRSRIWSSMAVL